MHPRFALMRPAQLTWGVRNEFRENYEKCIKRLRKISLKIHKNYEILTEQLTSVVILFNLNFHNVIQVNC